MREKLSDGQSQYELRGDNLTRPAPTNYPAFFQRGVASVLIKNRRYGPLRGLWLRLFTFCWPISGHFGFSSSFSKF